MRVGEWIYTFAMDDHSPLDHGVAMHFVEAHALPAKDTDRLWDRPTVGDIFTSVLLRQRIQHFDGRRDRYKRSDEQHLLFRIKRGYLHYATSRIWT
jgi:hypothetical protein